MSTPYRHAVAALRERHEEVERTLDETDAALAELATRRMELMIELDALAERLEVVLRPSLDASAPRPHAADDRRQRLGILAATSSVVAFGVAAAFSGPDAGEMRSVRCSTPPEVGCSVVKAGFVAEDVFPLPNALRFEGDDPDRAPD